MTEGWYLVTIAAVAVASWVVSLLAFPTRPCMWCHGEGCKLCEQTGRRQRPGARLIRKAAPPWRGQDK